MELIVCRLSMQVLENGKTPQLSASDQAGEYTCGQQTKLVLQVMSSWSTGLAYTAAESGYPRQNIKQTSQAVLTRKSSYKKICVKCTLIDVDGLFREIAE